MASVPQFPRYSATGADRSLKVLDIERMNQSRAKWHIYYNVNGVMHIHASWKKTAAEAAEFVAEVASSIHRGAKYSLIGAVRLSMVDVTE